MSDVVPACARNFASLTTNGLRQVIPARPPKPPVYTPTTVEKPALTLALTTAVTAGVKLYQTVRCDEEPPEQDDGGSPASVVAAEMSTTSLNGRAEMTVALAKASFDRETSRVQTGTASNTPSLNVSWVTPLPSAFMTKMRSEEHTSELQSPCNLVCRLLLEKKKKQRQSAAHSSHTARMRWQTRRK